MTAPITPDEQEQILQTIEMFEVITQSNPRDVQSLEILKDAYTRLGRMEDAAEVTKRLADSYAATGQYSSALLEYESLLKMHPDDPVLLAAVADIEGKMQQPGRGGHGGADQTIDLDFGFLMATANTRGDGVAQPMVVLPENDGNEAFGRFLMQHKIVSEDIVQPAYERVQRINKSLAGEALAASLIDEIVKSGEIDLENLMVAILDRSKLAYVPLEYYDVDRQAVRLIPETLALGRLIVPFDIVSRTVMIAMANPFDAKGKEAVQGLLDYNIQWHLASPAAIAKVLTAAYRLDERD